MNKEYDFICSYPFSYLGPLHKGVAYNKHGILYRTPGTNKPFITPHNHNYLEISLITEGEGIHHIKGNNINFKKRDFHIVSPNVLHCFTINSPRMRFHNLCISVKGMPFEITKLIYAASLPLNGSLNEDEFEQICEYFKNLNDLQYSSEPFAKEKIYAYVLLILAILLERGKGVKKQTTNSGYTYIEKSLEYIKENYNSEIKLEALANELHISPNYFSRIFSKHMGYTFNEYLNYYRVRIAEELIMENKKSLTEIAFEVGFGSLSSFSRSFHKHSGCSAKEFKSRFKGKN